MMFKSRSWASIFCSQDFMISFADSVSFCVSASWPDCRCCARRME